MNEENAASSEVRQPDDGPQPDAQAVPELDAGDPPVETSRATEVAVTESVIHEPKAGTSLKPSWRVGESKCLSAVAEPCASLDAPETGDEEPGLEL